MRRAFLLLMVMGILALMAAPAFAQVTEPADYGSEVSDFAGTLAANAWPIVLGLLGAIVGITLAVAGLKRGFRYIKGVVGK